MMVESRDRARNFAHHEFEINTSFKDGIPTIEPTHDIMTVNNEGKFQDSEPFEPTPETEDSAPNFEPPVATGADPRLKL